MGLLTHLIIAAAVTGAQDAGPPAGRSMEPMLECRSVADDAARLACYDAAMAAFADAGPEQLVVVDMDRIEAVERDGFGLAMPSLPDLSAIFSAGNQLGLEGAPAGDGAARAQSAEPGEATPAAEARPQVRVVERSEDGQIDKIELFIADIERRGYDGARLEMTNGQIWVVPNDADRLLRRGDPGDVAEIRRGAMGSFLMRLNGQGQAYRTRREQ
jgi:hypothetical protein